LMSKDFFSGWGIRTVAAGEARYNPMSYHNGSIWPHDNALIALGMARYGDTAAVSRVLEGLFEASATFDMRRLPELFCGFPRRRSRAPTSYPVACSPQAWSAATFPALIQASLGLSLDHASHAIRFHHPALPPFMNEVILTNLTIDDARASVRVHREASGIAVEVLSLTGAIQVTVSS
jgi:glycogen debranching enzyme